MSYPREWQEGFDKEWDRLAFVYADEPDVLRLWDKGPCYFCSEIFKRQFERCRRLEEVLREIIAYRQGEGKYDFSWMAGAARGVAAFDAWDAIEQKARKILEES